MIAVSPSLPTIDLAQVPESVRPAIRALLALLALVESLIAQNRDLQGKLDAFIRRYFGGQKNEGISPAQLELLFQDFAEQLLASPRPAPEPPVTRATPKRQPARQRVPADLPVRHRTELTPAEVQANPDAYRKIDETVTEILDYEPGRLCRDQVVRARYVIKCQPNYLSLSTDPVRRREDSGRLPSPHTSLGLWVNLAPASVRLCVKGCKCPMVELLNESVLAPS